MDAKGHLICGVLVQACMTQRMHGSGGTACAACAAKIPNTACCWTCRSPYHPRNISSDGGCGGVGLLELAPLMGILQICRAGVGVIHSHTPDLDIAITTLAILHLMGSHACTLDTIGQGEGFWQACKIMY